MRSFVSRTGRTIIVTLGPDGVLAATPDDFLQVPAIDIQPAATVVAGDIFCGNLAAGLSIDLPLEKILARAAAAGSLACRKAGAQPYIPLASEVDAVLSPQGPVKVTLSANRRKPRQACLSCAAQAAKS